METGDRPHPKTGCDAEEAHSALILMI